MKAISYLTFICCLVSMVAILIILFQKDGTEKSGGLKPEKGEMSYVMNKMDNEIPEREAGNMTTVFRNLNPQTQTKVILHDPKELIKYLNNNFLFYTGKVSPPAGFEWKLGMTPMYFTQETTNKLTMSFLPTLVESTRPANVIDYWTSKQANDSFYTNHFKPLLDTVIKAGFKSFIFDEGQLWP